MKEVYTYEKSLILSFIRCLRPVLSELTKGGANIMIMSKSKRIMQYIGTIVYIFSALYFFIWNLYMSIDLAKDIIDMTPLQGLLFPNASAITGPVLFNFLGLIIGFILLAIVYRKNKVFLPFICAAPAYILTYLSFVYGGFYDRSVLWDLVNIVCVLAIAVEIVYAIRLIGYGSKKEKVKQVSV